MLLVFEWLPQISQGEPLLSPRQPTGDGNSKPVWLIRTPTFKEKLWLIVFKLQWCPLAACFDKHGNIWIKYFPHFLSQSSGFGSLPGWAAISRWYYHRCIDSLRVVSETDRCLEVDDLKLGWKKKTIIKILSAFVTDINHAKLHLIASVAALLCVLRTPRKCAILLTLSWLEATTLSRC